MSDSNQQPEQGDDTLKTFDMYHFFSRKDVIAMIVFILLMLGLVIWKVLTSPAVAGN